MNITPSQLKVLVLMNSAGGRARLRRWYPAGLGRIQNAMVDDSTFIYGTSIQWININTWYAMMQKGLVIRISSNRSTGHWPDEPKFDHIFELSQVALDALKDGQS